MDRIDYFLRGKSYRYAGRKNRQGQKSCNQFRKVYGSAGSYWGKFKTVSQMFMLILLIADLGGAFNMIAQVLIWVSLVLTIVSLIDYIAKNVQVLTQGGM